MSTWLRPWATLRAAAWTCGIVAVLAYLNSLGNGFAYDDVHIILENERIHSLDRFWEAVTTPYWPIEDGESLGLWRPIASGVYSLLWNAFDGSPLPFHALNVGMHGLVTALVMLMLARLIPVAGAFAGGLVFAVHPVHTEVVANSVGFAELLGALTMVGACLLFLRWREEGFGAGRSLAIGATFGVGFLTKESAITLPGLFFLLDGYFDDLEIKDLGDYLRSRWSVYGAILVAAALVFWGRHAVLGSMADPLPPLGAELLVEIPRIWTVAEVWTHYVRLLFFPFDLSSEYSPLVIGINTGWNWINTAGAGFTLCALVLALAAWRHATPGRHLRSRAVGAAVLWFVITISPVSNFFFLSGTLLGERLLYMPSIALSLGVGWALLALLDARPRLRPVAVGGLVVILAAFTAKTVDRNPSWENTETVFLTLLDTHLEAGRAQWVVGDSFWEKNQVSAALRSYRYAIGSVGAGYSLIKEVTRKLLGIEQWGPAETLARMLWDDEPSWSDGPVLLAIALNGQGRHEEAAVAAEIAVQVDPEDPSTHHLLADIYRRLGRYDRAAKERRAAIAAGEGDRWEQWVWLAELEAVRGDTLQALAAADSARLRADGPDAEARVDSLIVELTPSPSTPHPGPRELR